MVGVNLDSHVTNDAARDWGSLDTRPTLDQADAFAAALADAGANSNGDFVTQAARTAGAVRTAQIAVPFPGAGPMPITPQLIPGTKQHEDWKKDATKGLQGLADWLAAHIHPAEPPHDAADPNSAKAPGKPGEAEGFADPKGGPEWVPNPNPGRGGSSAGWLDSKGRVWCPTGQGRRAHGGPHWDVQLPGGRNVNVYPGQHIDDAS